MSDNILNEIDEIMHQERMKALWDKYGRVVIAFIAGTILLTATISAYKAWDHHVRTTQTNTFLALSEAEDFPQNIDPDTLKLRAPLKAVALMNGAASALEQNNEALALSFYEAVAGNGSIPVDQRDLATIMAVRLLVDQETPDMPALSKRLEKVAGRMASPWRFPALLDLAALTAEQNDYKKARTYLATLIDEEGLPPSMHETARALDHVYAFEDKAAQE